MTLSTLLLLDLKCDLNNNDVDDNTYYPPRSLRLGGEMDRPLQASARGGHRRWQRGYPRPPPLIFVYVRDEEIESKKNDIEEKTLLIPLTANAWKMISEVGGGGGGLFVGGNRSR